MGVSEGSFFIKPRFPSGFAFQAGMFISISALWVGLLLLFNGRLSRYPVDLAVYGASTAILTLWILDALDYFESFHPIPRPDALLTLAVTVPVAAAISKYLMLTVFGLLVVRYRHILQATPLVCSVIYMIQVAAGIDFIRSGARRKICLLTSREEAAKVLGALRSRKLSKFYEPILLADLQNSSILGELAWMVISRSAIHRFERRESVIEMMLSGTDIVDYRELIARLKGHLELDSLDLWTFLNSSVRRSTFVRFYHSSKLVLERFVLAVLLALLFPLFLLIAAGVKMSSSGPVFYSQTRLGYRGHAFRLWKFRSMKEDAESQGHRWSKRGDSRITRFGALLRKSRLDELPQLWNVVRGEMSLIGPRPERPEFYLELEKDIPLFPIRLLVRPGITGWAQVMGGYAATIAQTKRKLEYDLFYLQRRSPKMDFIIVLRTIAVALRTGGS